ncbi:MAG: Tfp pilus assembly protein FimT/FimU [Desulfatirhabdiaceae bacterium]
MTDRGFTFIELIVVMILLAFAGSLVYVSVGRSIGGNQAKMFARELTVMMKTARRLAVEQGAPATLVISAQERTCHIDGEKRTLKIPEQIQVDAEAIQLRDDGGIELAFYADGSTNGGILSILVDNTPRYRIGVDVLTGTIQVKSGDDGVTGNG